jgi:UDP-N-acetylglucosamine:LPS N-acetylglucosamine transferase
MRIRRRKASAQPHADRVRRVLILSADVGEGHAAAARALAQQLEQGPEGVEVRVIDGLRGMGWLLHAVVEDGYRTQLEWIPWSYSIMYWLLEHVVPFRWFIRGLLCGFGSRSLERHIAEHSPDIIVSTYPAVTVVLARLRRLGRVNCPTVATITDMTGLFFWAQRGIDMHLVMYEDSAASVERIAGRDSVQLVAPLIDRRFLEPRERTAAREALGLPPSGKVIVVSGGGWGVGDITGAVDELARIPDSTLICLAGRNDSVQERLEQRFAGDQHVRVLGFTDKMPELLAAADVLVHSTGGVTCLEAAARGCPVVSYGLPVGHAKVNTKAMAAHGLLALAKNTAELVELVEATCEQRAGTAAGNGAGPAHAAADVVLRTPHRVRPLPAWRPMLARAMSGAMLALSAGTWVMSTDELSAAANVLLRVRSVQTVHTQSRDVAVIVRTPPSQMETVALELQRDGLHASFASAKAPTAAMRSTLAALGDSPLPALDPGKALNWISSGSRLRHERRALGLGHHFYFLQPPGGISVGQLVMARTTGATPVKGSVQLTSGTPLPRRPLRAGDVVVLVLDGSPASLGELDRFAGELSGERLAGVPFSWLA